MRKYVKTQVDGIISLLREAHDELKKAFEDNHISVIGEILEACQTGAISLGNLIEESEGEGFITIGMLEAYCEQIYQVYEGFMQGKDSLDKLQYENLQKSLACIENSLQNDIKICTEVVFLPYKASMWDSLESVWKAAQEDPDCDAYVIPIPYFDKDATGQLAEMHYEGELYPHDVPITGYTEYDFGTHRPDIIFIHNPYDECNLVTSVHPFFYSKNLKQFTDELIYIPYFVLSEVNPESEVEVESIEHFVTVPGVIHADKVIVQSEKMRQAYIKIMTKYAGESTRSVWEDKILGLGSPKFDKVTNTDKEDVEIPVEWLRIIQKTDGSWKKVMLYNTSVSALLEYNEEMLLKMQDVFEIFKENREEIALLWRPHPLIKATIESMRPQLWESYQKLVQKYQTEGWGIYDDTADLARAIAISDAYYGDPSSVVQLCQKKGIPVMIQNPEILKDI